MRIHNKLGRTLRRGFTLIELMIVVVIIGVLSSLAIYSVVEYINHSKTSEPREVIASIMAGQHAYNDEVGRFLDATGGLTDADFYPLDAAVGFDGKVGIMWGGASTCQGEGGTPCLDHFNTLGVVVDKAVLFRYANTTVAANTIVPDGGRAPNFNPGDVQTTRAGFVVQAASDLEGDGNGYTILMGWSEQAEIFLDETGE